VTVPQVQARDGAALGLPPGWVPVDVPGDGVGVAVADWPHEAGFRPNVVLLAAPAPPDATVRGLGTAAISQAIAGFDAQVIGYDVWPVPDGAPGRRLTFGYLDGAAAVAVTQWLFVQDGSAVTVTASCPVERVLAAGPAFDVALAGLRMPTRPAGPPPSSVPAFPEPRADPYLATTGVPGLVALEDLSGIAAARPWSSAGPTLHRDTLPALTAALTGPLRPGELSDVVAGQLMVLVEAGLLGPDHALTESGVGVASLLARPDARLRVEATAGRTALSFDAYLRAGRVLTVCTAPPADFAGRSPSGQQVAAAATTVRLDHTDVSYLPLSIAGWVGLAPAWSVQVQPERLRLGSVTARVEDPAAPPPRGANEHLREVWRQPWVLWSLRSSAGPPGLTTVGCGARGQFALTSAPGPSRSAPERSGDDPDAVVGFQAAASVQLWTAIVEQVDRAVTAPVRT
jgi:hypothetical protein